MKLPRRNFLHLTAGAVALPALPRPPHRRSDLSGAAGAFDRWLPTRRHLV